MVEKNSIVLVKMLLLSTSRYNQYKYTKDEEKKKEILSNIIGTYILYALFAVYGMAMCIEYNSYGMIENTPLMCAISISSLDFIFTFFKANGYLYNFKEYDSVMSLPFKPKTVAACKFLYMYIKRMPWYLSLSLSMMVGYGIFAKPSIAVYPLWIIMSFILPLIPMIVAAFLSFIITKLSLGFEKKALVQTALSFAAVTLCFFLKNIFDKFFAKGKMQQTLQDITKTSDKVASIYLPIDWFNRAITKLDLLGFILLIVTSVLLFIVTFSIVGRNYRQINTSLKSHGKSSGFTISNLKERSVVKSIAYKEYKRLISSTMYMLNVIMGEFLVIAAGIVFFVLGYDKVMGYLMKDIPVSLDVYRPAIPFIVYLFIGMGSTTTCTPSLEGKNLWIIKSLPIDKKTIYQGKILFNMYVTVPCMAFATLCMAISANVHIFDIVLYLIVGTVMCFFSSCWGCSCGIKHMLLDWENEVEVFQQNVVVVTYMLPNMFISVLLMIVAIVFGVFVGQKVIITALILIMSVFAFISYKKVMSLCR